MLNVDRGNDVDPGPQQVLDVLVAFAVLAVGRVGMRQFIHEGDSRFARDDRIHVHLRERDAVVLREPRRHDLERPDLVGGFGPVMGFNVPNGHIHPALF